MIRNKLLLKSIAMTLLITMLSSLISPTVTYALTSGPSQPEFSSFEPVTTTNMVNEFTGDFVYNLPIIEVPGPHGSSYPLSLSYHSGTTPEEEASWVGYGWTLNPGAINRAKRGFADDHNGTSVKYYNESPIDFTVTAGGYVQGEIFSIDAVSTRAAIRYNNNRGFGYNLGVGVPIGGGTLSLGYNLDNGQSSFSMDVNPTRYFAGKMEKHLNEKIKQDDKHKSSNFDKVSVRASSYGIRSFSQSLSNTSVSKYNGFTAKFALGGMPTFSFLQAGAVAGLNASVSTIDFENTTQEAYGYMYSSHFNDNNDPQGVMDYYYEKENPYDKHDVFIGLPFANQDNFIVSGEGLGGSFKLNNINTGYFRPGEVSNNTTIVSYGFEFEAGWNIGFGFDYSQGEQSQTIGDWKSSTRPDFGTLENNDLYFRFMNDMAGNQVPTKDPYSKHTPLLDEISPLGFLGIENYIPVRDDERLQYNGGTKARTSSSIDFSLNRDILSGNVYDYHEKRTDINNLVPRANHLDGIGEIVTYNEAGFKYVYGLPVYNYNEKQISYGKFKNKGQFSIVNNSMAYKNDFSESDVEVKIGQHVEAGYASTYLVTEILGSDYIDVDLFDPAAPSEDLGPSPNDYGGYTRFNYDKAYGVNSGDGDDINNFQWRMPYNGIQYSKNSLSDLNDDMGSFQSGEKEIYYLQSIETKTHAAIFYLDTLVIREDGVSSAIGNDAMAEASYGNQYLHRLSAIELYAREDLERDSEGQLFLIDSNTPPIKRVVFEYMDQGAYPGAPNDLNGNGKLTLEKVYFEYENKTTRTTPYVFDYNYPYPEISYPERYRDLEYETEFLTQNPGYDEFGTDFWGNYQSNGDTRFAEMLPGIEQNPNSSFDPAAWQLKQIKLPSGGEIHVQYEQDDYAYVQDQRAHLLVSLLNDGSAKEEISEFILNTSDLFNNIPAEEIDDTGQYLKSMLDQYYTETGQPIYFKMLYSLIGDIAEIDQCNVEYITGYAPVKSVSWNSDSDQLKIELKTDEGSPVGPRKICRDFYRSQRFGNMTTGNCNPNNLGFSVGSDETVDETKVKGMVDRLLSFDLSTELGSVCKAFNNDKSYVKIPVIQKKLGGGLRVKRLMLYDDGYANYEPQLFGTEYIYETKDEFGKTVSSGVATTEPGGMKDENAIIGFLPKKPQGFFNRWTAGRDKEQLEGPLGQSVMPGPSVGYSRVISRDINKNINSKGYSINEYYTAKDFPVQFDNTELKREKDKEILPSGLVNIFVNNTWMTQGFTIELNQMHGQPKAFTSYSGTYDPETPLAERIPIRTETHDYVTPGESLSVSNGIGSVEQKTFGEEVDITYAQKAIEENMVDLSLEFDADVGITPLFPIFFSTVFPSLTNYEGKLFTQANTKVISYPAIKQKVTVTQDGITHVSENLVFDESTGQPVVVKEYDEFNNYYLKQNIPANWMYKNLQSKGQYEKVSYAESFIGEGGTEGQTGSMRLVNESNESCSLLETVAEGDIIKLNDDPNSIFQVGEFDAVDNSFELLRTVDTNVPEVPETINGFTVIRSGRQNIVSASAGSIVFHNAEIQEYEYAERFTTDDFTAALSSELLGLTGTGTFKLTGTFDINSPIIEENISASCDYSHTSKVLFYYEELDGKLTIEILEWVFECVDGEEITVTL